jgi:Ca2+-binding EF-hand superfamily protein
MANLDQSPTFNNIGSETFHSAGSETFVYSGPDLLSVQPPPTKDTGRNHVDQIRPPGDQISPAAKAALPSFELTPFEVRETTDAASVLNKLSQHEDLLRRMTNGRPELTRDDIRKQLDLDRVASVHPDSPLVRYSSGAAHEDLQYADTHWRSLNAGSVKIDELSHFSSKRLTGDHIVLDGGHLASDVKTATAPTPPKPDNSRNLSPEEFNQAAQSVLQKIEKHSNGRVTRDDLYRAMNDPKITGKEAQALAVLYASYDALAQLSGVKYAGDPCITADGLKRFEQFQHNRTNANAFEDWAQDAFNVYGKDGVLTRDELKKALRSNPQDPDKTYLQYLDKHFDELVNALPGGSPNEITIANISQFYEQNQDVATALATVNTFLNQTSIPADTSTQLYGKGTPEASIGPDGVKQNPSLTDCYMLEPLQVLAQQHPEMLQKMIHKNEDGSYTVTFPGAPNNPIHVAPLTEAELRLFNHGGASGIWANVIEKAFGQMKTDESLLRTIGEALGLYNKTPEEILTDLGSPAEAIKLLTGQNATSAETATWTDAQMKAAMERALAEHKILILGTNGSPAQGILPLHAYAVVGLKPDGHGGQIVELREPTGNIVQVPMAKIRDSFGYYFAQG